MPRGKYVNHKGRNRHFTSPEELEQERKQEEMKKWRKKKQQDDDDENSEEESASGSDQEEGSSDNEGSDESSDGERKKSGVQGLIEIENPNRAVKKQNVKVKDLATAGSSSFTPAVSTAPSVPAAAPELSRREREEVERQQKQAHYQKLHAQGKTEQAKADLARLAIIRQQREEAAKMRELKKEPAKGAKK